MIAVADWRLIIFLIFEGFEETSCEENKEGISDNEGKNFWVFNHHTCVIMLCLSLQDRTGFWDFFFWEMFQAFHQDQWFIAASNPCWYTYFSSRECLIARNGQAFSGGNRFPIAEKLSVICFFSVTADSIMLVFSWKHCLLRKNAHFFFTVLPVWNKFSL